MCQKYNARVWLVLAAALMVNVTDRQTRSVPFPEGKSLSIEVTIGTVRIEGWDKAEAEIVIERHAPTTAQLARVPFSIEDTTARVLVRALQTDHGTDPAFRADVTVRLPRAALVERLQVLEGRIAIGAMTGSVTADIRRGPIEGRDLSGTMRLETGIGSIAVTGARLSAGGLLRLRTFNGDVRLTLVERPANARIMALALNGQITSDLPLTLRDTWGPRWGELTIGKGETVISLDVVTGTIAIKSP
jgi:DUF4097 and DUF4098 domain-containing protein YvlB